MTSTPPLEPVALTAPTVPAPPEPGVGASTLSSFFSGVGVILSLELRQRVRGTGWWILLGVYVVLVAVVTWLVTLSVDGFNEDDGQSGNVVYSAIIIFVLLLASLVSPAFSGNAINGDREAGTLATTQVTLVTTGQIVLGKFVAAWLTSLAFLAVSVPFLLYSTLVGDLHPLTILVSVLVLAAELGVISALGVGLSGLIARPLFSVVVTYLAVAALSVGTLIAFGLGGLAVQSTVTSTYSYRDYTASVNPTECTDEGVSEYQTPRFDYVWGFLVANPYVVLADAVPSTYNADGYTEDLFGSIKSSVRQAQIAPDLEVHYDECDPSANTTSQTQQEVIESTTPGWFVGLLIQLVLAIAALWGAWARTRTPAKRLAKGSRIA